MADESLKGLTVAILVADGFEQVALTEARKALDEAGARIEVVSPKADRVRGWKFTDWGDVFRVDSPLDQAKAKDFDALMLPGGVMNLDSLRMQPSAVAFAKAFFEAAESAAQRAPWRSFNSTGGRGQRLV